MKIGKIKFSICTFQFAHKSANQGTHQIRANQGTHWNQGNQGTHNLIH